MFDWFMSLFFPDPEPNIICGLIQNHLFTQQLCPPNG